MLNLLTVTNIFCRLSAILFFEKKELFEKKCSDLERTILGGGGYTEKMLFKETL